MASIEKIIDNFIVEYNLDTDEVKEPIIALVNKCIEGLFKHMFSEQFPETAPKTKTQKVLKADKIEDPSTVETRDELHNCTTGVLNQFCKEQEIKVGGNKAALVERVWRFLQGETTDDDKSARTKPKSSKKNTEKHVCSGCNAKGAPCGVGGTEEREGLWFCWRHISECNEIIAQKKGSKEPEPEITPVEKNEKPKPKKSKAKAAKQELVEEN
jgi:hypothetical protein